MSETALPKDEAQPALDAPVETPVTAPRRGNGLAVFALLLGAAGVAAGGWGLWQVRALQASSQQQLGQVRTLDEQAQGIEQAQQQLAARLAQLPGADELEERRRLVAQLQGDQQRLNQRLETVLGASRKDWRLAEAEHLLRLASLRLSALQDINSAQALAQALLIALQLGNQAAALLQLVRTRQLRQAGGQLLLALLEALGLVIQGLHLAQLLLAAGLQGADLPDPPAASGNARSTQQQGDDCQAIATAWCTDRCLDRRNKRGLSFIFRQGCFAHVSVLCVSESGNGMAP